MWQVRWLSEGIGFWPQPKGVLEDACQQLFVECLSEEFGEAAKKTSIGVSALERP